MADPTLFTPLREEIERHIELQSERLQRLREQLRTKSDESTVHLADIARSLHSVQVRLDTNQTVLRAIDKAEKDWLAEQDKAVLSADDRTEDERAAARANAQVGSLFTRAGRVYAVRPNGKLQPLPEVGKSISTPMGRLSFAGRLATSAQLLGTDDKAQLWAFSPSQVGW